MRVTKSIFVLCLAIGMLLTAGCSDTASTSNPGTPDLLKENLEKETTYRLHIAQPQSVSREMELSANPAYLLQKSFSLPKQQVT